MGHAGVTFWRSRECRARAAVCHRWSAPRGVSCAVREARREWSLVVCQDSPLSQGERVPPTWSWLGSLSPPPPSLAVYSLGSRRPRHGLGRHRFVLSQHHSVVGSLAWSARRRGALPSLRPRLRCTPPGPAGTCWCRCAHGAPQRRTISRGLTPPSSLTSTRRERLMTLNMLFERAEGLGGNVLHEQLADNIMGHQRADGPPAPGEIVHNAHMDEWTVRVQKPGDVHPATDPADMGEMHPMLARLQALPGGPAHGKAVPMRGHLHQAFGGVAGEDLDPSVMR